MFFNFWRDKKSQNIFSEFATKGILESTKIALSALVTAATGSVPIGLIVREAAKGMVNFLLGEVFPNRKKLDKLLKEPFLSGMRLLYEGILYQVTDEKSLQARDAPT